MSSIESKGKEISAEELERIESDATKAIPLLHALSPYDYNLVRNAYKEGAKAEYIRAHSSQPTGQLLSELKEYRAFLQSIRTVANIGVIRYEARQLIEKYPEVPLQLIKEPVVEMEKKK